MIRLVLSLLRRDLRHALRDPMLALVVLGPVLLVAVCRLGIPPVTEWLWRTASFRLEAYADLIAISLLLIVPQLAGLAAGFVILDERDERIIAQYGVTPLTRKGYLAYRLALPTLLAAIMTAMFLAASGIVRPMGENVAVLLLLALEAPLFALILAGFAANKVEGFALAKAGGLTLAGALAAWFVPYPWQWIGGLLPSYWPSALYLAAANGDRANAGLLFAAGLLLHAVMLAGLFRRFVRRAE